MNVNFLVTVAMVLHVCNVNSQQPEVCERVLCVDHSYMCPNGDYVIPPNECCARCFPKGEAPVNVEPVASGKCPALGEAPPSPFCISDCRPDGTCTRGRLCCQDHCTKRCKIPEPADPSTSQTATAQTLSCPAPNGYPYHCYNYCDNTYLPCFGNRLCCSNGCGKQCMDPVVTPLSSPATGPSPTPAPAPAPYCVANLVQYAEGQTASCYRGVYKLVCRNGNLVWETVVNCPPANCSYRVIDQKSCCAVCQNIWTGKK